MADESVILSGARLGVAKDLLAPRRVLQPEILHFAQDDDKA
jgi:hypothetical protein